MNKILFFARDPAGANVVIPLIKKTMGYDEYSIEVYAKDFAVERIEKENIVVTDLGDVIKNITEQEVFSFLKMVSPDIVITGTSLNDYTERYIWKSSQMLGIYSCCIIDQWINLGIRFSRYDYSTEELYKDDHTHHYLPSAIFVIDDIAKKMIEDDGVSGDIVKPLGSPHFDVISEKYLIAKQTLDYNGKDSQRIRIVFASEPMSVDYGDYWGLSEETSFELLMETVDEISDELGVCCDIIIRPHPREKVDKWDYALKRNISDKLCVALDNVSDSFQLMASANIVCGMSSMFLIEAIVCGIPTISIMKGLKQENPFIFDKMGIMKSAMSKAELYKKLKGVIEGNQESVSVEFKHGATDRIWNSICEGARK